MLLETLYSAAKSLLNFGDSGKIVVKLGKMVVMTFR